MMRSRLLVAIGLLAAWNVLINWVVPSPLYVPANVGFAVAMLLVARRWGLDNADFGTERSARAAGVRLGAAVGALAVIAIVMVALWPWSRRFFEDATLVDVSVYGLLYQILVRIPLGTAVVEEVLFRGVFFGLWERVGRRRAAIVGSSALFGLWHVLPTLGRLDLNPAGGYAVNGLAEVGLINGAVAATALAGLGFAWLRLRSRSIAAPVIVHACINSTAFLAGWLIAN